MGYPTTFCGYLLPLLTHIASFKVVVLRNVFDPKDFDEDASRILEISSRLREHCAKFGRVTKVVVYDKHEDGVAQVFFGTPEEADVAISMLNGRMFSGKDLVMKAATWDGKEKFKVRTQNCGLVNNCNKVSCWVRISTFIPMHSRWPRRRRRRRRGWPTGTSSSTRKRRAREKSRSPTRAQQAKHDP